jgi:hypothetical protein
VVEKCPVSEDGKLVGIADEIVDRVHGRLVYNSLRA